MTTGTVPVTLKKPDGLIGAAVASFNPLHSQFEAVFFLSVIDPTGTWTATLAKNSLADSAGNLGPSADRTATFNVAKAIRVITVSVVGGSDHFRGEIVDFYILAALDGDPVDVTSVGSALFKPDGSQTLLAADRLQVGLYRIRYNIPGASPFGTYTLAVTVSGSTPEADIKGVGLASFSISETLTLLNARVTDIQNGVATIQTDIGTMRADIATIRPVITRIDSGVVRLQTDVGAIMVDIAAIRPVVTQIQGDVATVKTDVGTLSGRVTSIDGNVATIQTAVGEIRADVSQLQGISSSVSNVLTVLYIATVLALIAAIGAIAAVAVIMRRLAK